MDLAMVREHPTKVKPAEIYLCVQNIFRHTNCRWKSTKEEKFQLGWCAPVIMTIVSLYLLCASKDYPLDVFLLAVGHSHHPSHLFTSWVFCSTLADLQNVLNKRGLVSQFECRQNKTSIWKCPVHNGRYRLANQELCIVSFYLPSRWKVQDFYDQTNDLLFFKRHRYMLLRFWEFPSTASLVT